MYMPIIATTHKFRPRPTLTNTQITFIVSQEAKEAEELMRAIQAKRGPDALAHMAEDRKRQMSSFLDSLEEKYASNDGKKGGGGGGGSSGKGKKKAKKQNDPEDIDDEEFEKLRASITKGKGRE